MVRVGRSLCLGVCLLWWSFQQRPSNNKKQNKTNVLHHPSLLSHVFSPLLFDGCEVDVRCLSSPCLWCLLWVLCGRSYQRSPRQWSSHKTNVSSSEQLSKAHGARAASASNWRKMRGTWRLLVGCWCGGVTPPHFPPVVVVPLMKHCWPKPAL